jgi:hypothetical protein
MSNAPTPSGQHIGPADAEQVLPEPLTGLYQAVVPLWQRHLATAQDHAELAVTEMLAAFTDIHPYLERSLHQSQQLHAAPMASDDGLDHLAQVCDSHLLPLVPGLDADGADAVLQVLDAVHRVVGRVERITRPVSTDTPHLLRQVERMLVGLQYQDRISQMMALLIEDMQHMQDLLSVADPDRQAPSAEAWMARLESRYAMAAQRHAHQGSSDTDGASPLRPDAEPDYF